MHRPLTYQQRELVMTDSSYGCRAAALTRSLGTAPTTIVSTIYTSALGHEMGDARLLELAVANALDFVYQIRLFVLELSSDSTMVSCTSSGACTHTVSEYSGCSCSSVASSSTRSGASSLVTSANDGIMRFARLSTLQMYRKPHLLDRLRVALGGHP